MRIYDEAEYGATCWDLNRALCVTIPSVQYSTAYYIRPRNGFSLIRRDFCFYEPRAWRPYEYRALVSIEQNVLISCMPVTLSRRLGTERKYSHVLNYFCSESRYEFGGG